MYRLCMGCMERYDGQFEVCPHCGYVHGTPVREAYHIIPSSVLAKRYIVGKVLGFGGFGITYIGYDTVLDQKVAIKEYLPSEFATRMPRKQAVTVYSGEREEQFRAGLKKILDEARSLAQFQDEPGIVHIYDCFEANSTAYIIMEYLDGESLKEKLARDGKMAVGEALPIVLSVLAVLKKVHAANIIHRDIAPDNIYLLKTGEVKLLDFGAARYATTQHSKSLSVILKPGYAPEEQYRSRGDQGTWTDVYALAATFYKMLTGITPEDAMERSVKDSLKEPSKLGVQIKKNMETALLNAMNVKIEDRTQTAEAFETELIAAEVKRKNATQEKKDFGKMPPWIKIIGVIAVVSAGIFVGLLSTGVIPVGDKAEAFVTEDGQTRVPDVRNEAQENAVSQITEASLLPVLENAAFSDEVLGGRVIAQNVEGGSTVGRNTEIALTISAGKELVQMPRLTGLTKEEAIEKLNEAGISYSFKEELNNAPEGTVAEQSIDDSVQVEKQSAQVELIISLGMGEFDEIKELELPNLSGREIEEVRDELAEYGITVREEKNAYSKEVEKGKIISQEIQTGNKVKTGDVIKVSVSLGVETVQMPLIEYKVRAEAEKLLKAAKLVPVIKEQYNSNVPKGSVISAVITDETGKEKEIKAQELIETETEIILYVSLGAESKKTNSNSGGQKNNQTSGQSNQRNNQQNSRKSTQGQKQEAAPAQTQPPAQQPVQQPVQQPAQQPAQQPVQPQNSDGGPDVDNIRNRVNLQDGS